MSFENYYTFKFQSIFLTVALWCYSTGGYIYLYLFIIFYNLDIYTKYNNYVYVIMYTYNLV